MAKIGFVNDVVRGIKKVIDGAQPKTETVKETVVVNNNVASSNTNALLERAFMFLEDGKWAEADEYCEKVLDAEPKNAEAYLGKLMAELQIKTKDNLKNVSDPFDGKDNCVKASRFDSAIAEKLKADNEYIRDRNENTRKIGVYNKANTEMKLAKTEEEFKSAAVTFNSIKGFMNSDAKAKECLEKAENARKDAIYDLAISEMKKHKTSDYESAISNFERIIDWKDSRNKINECNKGIEDIRIAEEKAEAERKRKAEEARIAAEKAKEKTKKIAIVVTPIVAAVVVFLIVLNTVILPASNYKKAKEMFKNAKVGDMIIFGTYEQDNKITNGKEAIEWRVLAKEGNKVLIISEKALDCQQYNSSWTDVTWETCTLRKWMNKDFYNSAFNAGEQTIIADTKVTADPNPSYSTNPGNDTTDKVFLLSIDEAYKYFSSVEDRKCVPTAYAISNGADTSSSFTKNGEATCCWWLRSPGGDYGFAAIVNYVGLIGGKGDFADYSDYCVRPALWIEIG
ncbi:MAG: DUF6273 domain-containing protein, partial [Ruminococcus sp.]|nr:DUF6273 domain-containing protein [Ruminococcus sp.]